MFVHTEFLFEFLYSNSDVSFFLHARTQTHKHKTLLLRWNRINCWVYFEINNNKLAPFKNRPFHSCFSVAHIWYTKWKKIDFFRAKMGECVFHCLFCYFFFLVFFCFIACILHKHCLIFVRNDCVLFLCENTFHRKMMSKSGKSSLLTE